MEFLWQDLPGKQSDKRVSRNIISQAISDVISIGALAMKLSTARSIERQKTLTSIMVTGVRKVTAIVEATDMLVKVGGGFLM